MKKQCLRTACCGILLLMSGCAWPWFSSPATVETPEAKVEAPAAKVEQPAQTTPSIPLAPPSQAAQAARFVPEKAMELLNLAKKLWIGEYCSDPEKATAMLDAALEFAPDYAEAYLWRGRALSDLGYLADAFDDFTRSIQLHPTAMAYAARGLSDLRMGNMDGAEQDLARALELDDQEPLVYVYRAAQLFLQGQDRKACTDLAAACKRGMCEPEQNAHRDKLCR